MNVPQCLAYPVRVASAGSLRLLLAQPSSPWVPITVFLPLALAGVLWNLQVGGPSTWLVVVLPFVGLLLWTLLEYFFHSAGFHWPVPARLQSLQASHWSHHEDPKDPSRIITRLSFSLPMALVLWSLCALVLRSWQLAALPMAGLIVGYLAYETVHFGIHRWRRGRWLLRPLVKHHLYHHYKDDTRCFGVTTRFWDWVFRTGKQVQEPVAGGEHSLPSS